MELVIVGIVASAIWVAVDAHGRGLNWWTWGAGTLLLWIVVFPYYLTVRGKVAQRPTPVPALQGRWEPDPRNPDQERWREGERWTRAIRDKVS